MLAPEFLVEFLHSHLRDKDLNANSLFRKRPQQAPTREWETEVGTQKKPKDFVYMTRYLPKTRCSILLGPLGVGRRPTIVSILSPKIKRLVYLQQKDREHKRTESQQ